MSQPLLKAAAPPHPDIQLGLGNVPRAPRPEPPLGRELAVNVLAALLIFGIAYAVSTRQFGYRPDALIRLGTRLRVPSLTQGLMIYSEKGYDGQYYYAMAHDPLLRTGLVRATDWPRVRGRRILFPLAAWALAGGQHRLMVFSLLATNLLCIGGTTALAVLFCRRFRAPPASPILFTLAVNLYTPALWSLAEPMMVMLLLGAVYALVIRRSDSLFLVCASLAALTRESAILLPLAVGLARLGRPAALGRIRRWLPLLAPAGVLAGWQTYVAWRVGPGPESTLDAVHGLAWPVRGLIDRAGEIIGRVPHTIQVSPWIDGAALLIWVVAAGLAVVQGMRRRDGVTLFGLLNAGLMLTVTPAVLNYPGLVRGFAALPLALWVEDLRRPSLVTRACLAALALTPLPLWGV